MDSLLIINENKSHYVYIKSFDRSMFQKTKNKNKYLWKSFLQCFSSKNVLNNHKEVCLSIYGAQSIKFKKEQLNLKMLSGKYPMDTSSSIRHRFNIEIPR